VITTDPYIDTLIDRGAPIIICVSGGKDSRLAADETVAYARARNYRGQITLVYSDLGRVVWSDAKDQCRRLAARLSVELVIVGRKSGDLMDRWAQRWAKQRDSLWRAVMREAHSALVNSINAVLHVGTQDQNHSAMDPRDLQSAGYLCTRDSARRRSQQ
jgi:hypothetical protein